MTHFSMAAWADFARGLITEGEVRIMEAHLGGNCADCKDIALFWNKVSTISSRMAGRSAPAAAVRLAKAIFPVNRTVPKRFIRIAAELIFDSRVTPALAGMRSGWQVGWQCVYRAGESIIDLRIEPGYNASRAALIGQVSNPSVPGDKLSDITVQLKSGRAVVAETRTNRYGEFQFEYVQQPRLQLCFILDGGSRRIQVPMKKIASHKALTDQSPLGPVPARKRQGTGSSS